MKNILKKNTEGYGYKYTELKDINEFIASIGEVYTQELEPNANGNDYVITHRINAETGEEIGRFMGCKVPEAPLNGGKKNPAQEYGSGLTYARRYSLLMAYGLSTTDNDAEDLTVEKKQEKPNKPDEREIVRAEIQGYADANGLTMAEIAKDYQLNAHSTADRLKEVLADLKGGEK